MLWTIFELAVNLFQVILVVQTITEALGAKYTGLKKQGIAWIFILLIFLETSFVNSILPFEGLAIVIPILMIFIYSMIALCGSWKKKLFTSLMLMVMIIGVTAIVMNVTGLIFGRSYIELVVEQNTLRFATLIIIQIIIFYITRIILLQNNKNDVSLSWEMLIVTLLLPCISILILSLSMELTIHLQPEFQEKAVRIATIVSIGIFTGDILTYCMYRKLKNDAAEKMEYEILRERYSMQEKNMNDLKLLYSNLQKTRHDIKHHINLLKELLERRETEDAIQYLKEYSESLYANNTNTIFSDSIIINYIINSKVAIMNQKGIRFYCDICDKIQGVSDVDINIILGNLLENAIEGCQHYDTDAKEIRLSIYKKAGYMIIDVENTYKGSLEDVKHLKTTKADKKNHGFGILSVKDVAEKYNGNLNIKEKDNKVESICILEMKI